MKVDLHLSPVYGDLPSPETVDLVGGPADGVAITTRTPVVYVGANVPPDPRWGDGRAGRPEPYRLYRLRVDGAPTRHVFLHHGIQEGERMTLAGRVIEALLARPREAHATGVPLRVFIHTEDALIGFPPPPGEPGPPSPVGTARPYGWKELDRGA